MKNIVSITALGTQGDGIGTHEDKPIYVAKTAPGDVAEVTLHGERDGAHVGKLAGIVTPAPERVEPPCPYFARCGGCSLQHVSADFYRAWKIEKVRHALERAGVKVKTWEEPVFLPPSTRRRTTVTALKRGAQIIMGYNEARSHAVVDIQSCLILEPELEKKIIALRAFLPRLLPDNKSIDITLQDVDGLYDMVLTGPLQTGGKFSLEQHEVMAEMAETLGIARLSFRVKDFAPVEILFTRQKVVKKFGAITVALAPGAFLQASAAGEKALTDIVLKYTKGAGKILDLFSGSGTFSGPMLAAGAEVTAMDGDKHAMAALAASAHPKLAAIQRDLFKNPPGEREMEAFDAVIFDPPRAGAKELAGRMAYAEIPKIIGISCNPVTFARDAALLQEGGYRLQSLTLVDQFVYSAHAEIAGLFAKS